MQIWTRSGALLALAFVPLSSHGQAPAPNGKADAPPVRRKVEQATKQKPQHGGVLDLKLTAEQKERLKAIRTKAREKVNALGHDQDLTPMQRRARAAVIRADAMAEAEKALTPEQRKRLRGRLELRRGGQNAVRPGLLGRPGGQAGPGAMRPWLQRRAGVVRPWLQARPGMQGPRPWLRGRLQQGRGWF